VEVRLGDRPAFILVGLPPTPEGPHLLGVWAAAPLRPGPVAFGQPPRRADGLTWQANLPANSTEASVELTRAETRIRAADRALPEAAERLKRFAEAQGVGTSFAAGPATGAVWGEPERELAALLGGISTGRTATSFGLMDMAKAGWGEASEWFSSAAATLLPTTLQARVETSAGGTTVARSKVGWTGDCATVWSNQPGGNQATLHLRTVTLALASRVALVRTLALALQGAGLIAVAIAIPGGPLLALPAVWRFITRVQDEIMANRENRNGGESNEGWR
jgi:hypothetical protein